MITQYLSEHWPEVGGILILGIIIGAFTKLAFSTFFSLAEILASSSRILREGKQVTDVYNEVYPLAHKIREDVKMLGTNVWCVQTFHDHQRKIEHYERQLDGFKFELGRAMEKWNRV